MGHAIPDTDMDSLGACLAVYRAATLLGKRARIVLKDNKEMNYLKSGACSVCMTDNKIVLNAFWGIRIAVIILVILTIRDMWKQSVNSVFSYIMYILILLALILFPISPAIVIVSSALIAICYSNIMKGVKRD